MMGSGGRGREMITNTMPRGGTPASGSVNKISQIETPKVLIEINNSNNSNEFKKRHSRNNSKQVTLVPEINFNIYGEPVVDNPLRNSMFSQNMDYDLERDQ
jgi:hypothetical protein